MKTFLTIIGILLSVIIVCIGINGYRRYEDRQLLAKQKQELEQQSQEIFSRIEDDISQANQNISETDEIIKMSAVGDILSGESMVKDGYVEFNGKETYDFSHVFSKVSKYINNADIVMGTMETNFTSGKYTDKNTPKEFAKEVKKSGVNVVTIAHNHSLDCGLKGLKDTKSCLKELGYDTVGDKLDDKNAVLIKQVKDTKIAFLTYTYGINNESSKTKKELNSVNIYSKKQVKSDMKYAKKQGADCICVMIHWGDVSSSTVSDEQRKMADYLVEQGADIIIGAHPSVVQPMEIVKNKEGKNVFIAYSIGTYISTLVDEDSKVELVLNIELRKSGKDGEVYLNKVDYTPIYVLDNGQQAENRYELIDMKSAATSYASGDTNDIDRATYDKLLRGIDKLKTTLSKKK